ncbi:TonB-dependent receptor [Sphingomonas solaris]|uniref:TonB-dependent receptor n=1 Tax=Alterirhizorhabdus solaris TaxID=2529389 RepID=A0A558RBP6_9SPHN|nr:TonB-dependent receptor [Sphingomonas solaris]TVV76758.1 TonB-dependent receptor [Sphingomonas solaris]
MISTNGRHCVAGLKCGVALAAMLAAAAQAQVSPDAAPAGTTSTATAAPEPENANDIIVTAQRRAERLESVPVAIVALSGDTLAKSGVQRLTDLGQVATGVQINRGGSFTQPAIRGITTLTLGYGFENNVAVYVDGFYQPDMVTINGDLANLSSVQVLKGPQGALYGRNATAGAIVMETLTPSKDLTANGQASYGRFNDYRLQGYVSGPINEKISVGVAAYYRSSDGYITDIGADPVSKSDDTDAAPLKNFSLRGKILLEPTDNLKVTLGYNHGFVEDSRGVVYTVNRYPSAAIRNIPGRATERDTASSSIPANAKAKADEFTGKITLDTGIGTLSSYTGYAKRHSNSVFDFDASRPVLTQSSSTDIEQRTFQQTLDYSINAINNLDLIVGAFYYNDKLTVGDAKVYAGSIDAAGLIRFQDDLLTSKAYAFYLDATYHLTDRLFLTGGVRYSHEKRRIAYTEFRGTSVNAPAAVFPPADKSATFSSATPRAVLRYELADRTNVYASFSTGFRSGVFNPTAAASPALVIPIKPEKLRAYEVGFKTASSTFRLDTAAYYYDFRNLQVGVTTQIPGPPIQVVQLISNAKKAEVYGAEAQATFTPVRDLNLRAGVSYVHARYKDFKNATGVGLNTTTQTNVTGQVQDWSGKQMARAPGFTSNVGVDYTIDLAGGRLAASANGSYTSSFVVANPSLFGPLAGAALANKQRYRQKGYALLNAQLNWTDPSGHYTLGVYGDNITNTRFNFVLSGGAFGDYSQGNEPVTYGVRAGFKF